MTITLDTWQPIILAIIGGLFALGVPVVSAWLSSRSSKRAAEKIGTKVDVISKQLAEHQQSVANISFKVDGERTKMAEELAEARQALIEELRKSRQRQQGSDGS